MIEVRTRIPQEIKKRAEKAKEDGEVSSEAEYFAMMIEAGESNVAALDPRTNSKSEGEDTQDIKEKLLAGLTKEYQPIEEAIDPVIEQYRSSVAHQLSQMADHEASPVEHDPLKGYRVNND